MKLPLSFWLFVVAGFIAPAGAAGQQSGGMGQKARPDPVAVPIVLAQASTSGAGSTPQQPDYILNACQETEHTVDPRSALRGVDPAYMLKNYIQERDKRSVNLADIKITLLESAKHGQITAGVSNTGRVAYRYDPEAEYLGNDKAVFMAEFEGKHYKIVVDIKVLYIVDETASQCGEPQLIKVNKPTSGPSGLWLRLRLNTLSVTFADLTGRVKVS